MGFILNLDDLTEALEPIKGIKTTGLVTGCFDLLHPGHIDFLKFAKSHVDILVVGIDSDLSIQKTKGKIRPINTQEIRADMLSELISVDYVLLLENPHNFKSKQANEYYDSLVEVLRPNYLITNKFADNYWELKKNRIERAGGILLLHEVERKYSTTDIIGKALENYKSEATSDYIYDCEKL